MYVPKINLWQNETEVLDFIQKNTFATVCISDDVGKIHAVHIPVLYQPHDATPILHGHVAKGNPVIDAIDKGKQALVIFSGAHSYVSSSWYAEENVSTWNYVSVHVYGTLQKLTDEELIASVTQLTKVFENGRDNARTVDTMSDRMFNRELRGIVGFKLAIESMEAKKKMSQNRNDADYKNIVQKLSESEDPIDKQVSDIMKKERTL